MRMHVWLGWLITGGASSLPWRGHLVELHEGRPNNPALVTEVVTKTSQNRLGGSHFLYGGQAAQPYRLTSTADCDPG